MGVTVLCFSPSVTANIPDYGSLYASQAEVTAEAASIRASVLRLLSRKTGMGQFSTDIVTPQTGAGYCLRSEARIMGSI